MTAPDKQGGQARRPHAVVLGAGFGGVAAARALDRGGLRVTLVDRQNHHLFQPLLYQVATAALSPADIARPVRRLMRGARNTTVLLAEATGVDAAARRLNLRDGEPLDYDALIVATGGRAVWFGHDDWSAHAPGLKSLADARDLRSRLLLAFERAERCGDAAERSRLLTFVIVGGGPTGVEMAGAIAELSRHTLARDFRNIRPEAARVVLIEAGPRLLPSFSPALSDYAAERLRSLGVEVRFGAMVSDIDATGASVGDERIPAGLVVWGAGVAASAFGEALGVPLARGGRIPVTPSLEVRGLRDIYAIGDVAACEGENGPLPGLAQVAKQQGRHLGEALAARLTRGAPIPPFAYRSRGEAAVIGRHAAVFETRRHEVRGWIAWLLWAVVHVAMLSGRQNRASVMLHWLWRYATYERGARLIAEDVRSDSPARARREPVRSDR